MSRGKDVENHGTISWSIDMSVPPCLCFTSFFWSGFVDEMGGVEEEKSVLIQRAWKLKDTKRARQAGESDQSVI